MYIGLHDCVLLAPAADSMHLHLVTITSSAQAPTRVYRMYTVTFVTSTHLKPICTVNDNLHK